MNTRNKAITVKIISISIILFLAFSFVINNGVVKGQGDFQTFLPIVLKEEVTQEPTPEPMPGENEQCSTYGGAEICASVSNATPKQYTNVTVYGKLLINGSPQSGKPMHTVWHYKSTSPTCDDGVTNASGIASCTRGISRASIGYEVVINVEIEGYEVNTSFTPVE